MSTNLNPWEIAQEASEESAKQSLSSDFWGQVRMEVWLCALVKDVGKVPYDPAVHKRYSVAIDMFIDPLPDMGLAWSLERHMLDWEDAWFRFTKPSILECEGAVSHVKELPGKWVRVRQIDTGETFEKKDGTTAKKTAIQFLKIFPSEADCRMDYLSGVRQDTPTTEPQPTPAAPSNGNGNLKAQMLPFAKVIVENATKGQTDLNVIRQTIAVNLANYPMLKDVFTVDSPEIMQLIMEAVK